MPGPRLSAQAERLEAAVARHKWVAAAVARVEAGLDGVPTGRLGPALDAACVVYGHLAARGAVPEAARVLDTVRRGAGRLRRRLLAEQMDLLAVRVYGRDEAAVRRLVRDGHAAARARVAAASARFGGRR